MVTKTGVSFRCAQIAGSAGIIATLLGALALMGWGTQNEALKSWHQDVAMSPVTAVCVILCGVALCLQRRNHGSAARTWGSRALALVVVSVGVLVAFEQLSGVRNAVDQLLFNGSLHGLHIAPNTAAALILTGCSLLAISAPSGKVRASGPILAISATTIAMIALAGYACVILALYRYGAHTPMALPTAVALAVLGAGLVCARPETEPVASLARRWSVERSIVAGFGALLALLTVVSMVAYSGTMTSIQAAQQVDQMTAELATLGQFEAALNEAETGQRGYLVTSDAKYRAPYDKAVPIARQTLTQLHQMLDGDPVEAVRLSRLDAFASAKLSELARTVALCEGGNAADALSLLMGGDGESAMESARSVVNTLRDRMNADLETRREVSSRAQHNILRTIIVGAWVAFATVALAGACIYFGMRGRKRAEHALAESEERFRQIRAHRQGLLDGLR